VISELRGKSPDPKVTTWIQAHADGLLFMSVVTVGEIRTGIEQRRPTDPVQAQALEKWLRITMETFKPRLLDITESIAEQWGRWSPDQPIADNDGWIAATGLIHDLTVVTRNVPDFKRTGVKLLNPFEQGRATHATTSFRRTVAMINSTSSTAVLAAKKIVNAFQFDGA
jgi:predicted nucleic acid-binding protein